MSFWRSNSSARDALAQVAAISKSQAVIEFNMDGTIITANQNFLDAMGYRLDEIQGKHHSMFVAPDEREQRGLSRVLGQPQPRRISGRRIQADRQGRPRESGSRRPTIRSWTRPASRSRSSSSPPTSPRRKIRSMEDAGKIAAIGRAQAVIEFNLDGTIITANENFLATLGYSLDEIQGKHHSMFVGAGRARQRRLSRILGEAQPRRIPVRRIQALRQGRQGGLDSRLLQSDPRRHRQAVQGGEIRLRRHRAEAEDREFRRPDRGDRQVAGGDRVQHGRHGPDRQRELPRRARLFAGRDPGQASQHVRAGRPSATARPIANSGRASTAANSRRANTSASARAAGRSGSRPPTIRSAISTASRSRW